MMYRYIMRMPGRRFIVIPAGDKQDRYRYLNFERDFAFSIEALIT